MLEPSVVCVMVMVMLGGVFGGDQPNLLLIMADDLGAWALEAYGAREIRTPTLAQLARDGITFDDMTTASPVCSAARMSWFTARPPSSHGMLDWLELGNGCSQEEVFFAANETFTSDVFAATHEVSFVGKLHLGANNVPQHNLNSNPDKFYLAHQSGGGSYLDPPLVINGECTTLKDEYVTDVFANATISYLQSYATRKETAKPFVSYLHFTAPHSPYTGSDGKAASMHPASIVNSYMNATFSDIPANAAEDPYSYYSSSLTGSCLRNKQCYLGYYAALTAMDMAIGRVLDTLHSTGLHNNTIVVFTSDHGFSLGHHGMVGKGNARWPLNGFETNIKVPYIMRYPGVVPPNTRVSLPVSTMDAAATILDIVGASFPMDKNVAGVSFLPLLTSPSNPPSPFPSFSEYGQMRVIKAPIGKHGTLKLVHRMNGLDELFNLTADANETTNLKRTLWPRTIYPGSMGGLQNYYTRAEKYGEESVLRSEKQGGPHPPTPGSSSPPSCEGYAVWAGDQADNPAACDRASEALMQTMKQYFSYYSDPHVDAWRERVTGNGQMSVVTYYGLWDHGVQGWGRRNLEESSPVTRPNVTEPNTEGIPWSWHGTRGGE